MAELGETDDPKQLVPGNAANINISLAQLGSWAILPLKPCQRP